jgi:predicted methyltransferase
MSDVDEILSHCFFAIGTGAEMPIKADAIQYLRNRYRDAWTQVLDKEPNAWDEDGHFVLDYCRSIGRLAAQTAISEGANRIDVSHVERAADTVQRWVQAQVAKDTRFCAP